MESLCNFSISLWEQTCMKVGGLAAYLMVGLGLAVLVFLLLKGFVLLPVRNRPEKNGHCHGHQLHCDESQKDPAPSVDGGMKFVPTAINSNLRPVPQAQQCPGPTTSVSAAAAAEIYISFQCLAAATFLAALMCKLHRPCEHQLTRQSCPPFAGPACPQHSGGQ
jgi:hypothetical protein